MRSILTALVTAGLFLFLAPAQPVAAQNLDEEPPGGDYKKVSSLVELPEFVPGLGILYVQPSTLPAGPFLAYDRDGSLVSTVYMVPLDELNNQTSFTDLGAADRPVDHVNIKYNPGHPGVDEPHYHVTLWHVNPEKAQTLQTE